MNASLKRTAAQRLDIQGLRMLAVGSVVVNHLFDWPIGGFVGVDVFFVISGFLITGLLLREFDRSGRISMKDFYRRRIKRLMPAALTVLAVTLTAGAFLLSQPRSVELAWDALFAAIFGANWRYAATGTDYFQAGQPPSALQHYWSLSVEEQFYVVWPLLIIAVTFIAAKLGAGVRGRGIALFAAIAAVTLGSLAWAAHETATAQSIAYFSTFSRGWELGVGAALAIGLHFVSWRPPVAGAVALAYVGMAGIVVSWFVINPEAAFPFPTGLLPVLATAAVLLAGADQPSVYGRATIPLTNPVSKYIGDISYSLYLWHFPVIILGLAVIPRNEPLHWVISLVLMLVLSAASYHWIENPARRAPWLSREWKWTRRRTGVVAGIAVAAVVLTPIASVQIAQNDPDPELADVASSECQGAAAIMEGCDPDTATGATTPSLDNLTDDNGVAFDCWRFQGEDFPDCIDEVPEGDGLRVAVVGDSHAAMYLSSLMTIAEERGWQLDRFVGNGCQWVVGIEGDCSSNMVEIHERLTDAEEPYDVIITSAARWAFEDHKDVPASFAEAWAPAIENGTKVIVLEDAPTFTDEALECLNLVPLSPYAGDCHVSLEDAQVPPDPLPEAAELAGAELVETRDFFCDASSCPAVIGGVIVFRDTVGHVTESYIETLTPYLAERIDAALA